MTHIRKLRVLPQTTPLHGTITVPGDKSISHRAVMFAALAEGTSHIRRWLPAGDTLATLAAMRALGVVVTVDEAESAAWNLTVAGRGLDGLQPPDQPLDCRNAGTCMRLLAGIMAGQAFASVLDGTPQLRNRPMRRIIQPLQQMGADIISSDDKAPLTIRPAQLEGIAYRLPVASAQVKSAVLLAGLYAKGATHVIEPGPARDHTERMLAAMNADIIRRDDTIILAPHRSLWPLHVTIPADISSAAFPLVAAAIVPHSEIVVTGIGRNPTRTGILDILAMMGAEFSVTNEIETGGEPAADVACRFSELHSAAISGDVVVRAIDEFPILTVAATQAAGVTTVRDAAELRVKEVDRISILAGELRKMGVTMVEHADGYTVQGPIRLRGAEVDSHDDHRLGMALAVAALIADRPTTILQANCIADSFPGFVETMQMLGATMQWEE
ncbi:MAG: 3-phosphoshikimate 1-carboxyvinyltransferase [Anaerolineae bacterium]|nr:3-phosphoshikimate 1-carboxyvinyltransferase [Anaerolineae bacterium]